MFKGQEASTVWSIRQAKLLKQLEWNKGWGMLGDKTVKAGRGQIMRVLDAIHGEGFVQNGGKPLEHFEPGDGMFWIKFWPKI